VEASFIYSKDSIRSLAQQLGYYNTVASWRYLDTYVERVRAVTAEDLKRVARTYLTENSRTVGWYDPTTEGQADAGNGAPAEAAGAAAPSRWVDHYRPGDAADALPGLPASVSEGMPDERAMNA